MPLTDKVKSIQYHIGEATLEGSGYVFDTTLFVNGKYRIPMYTIVEPVDGEWIVNVRHTFNTVNEAALAGFTKRFADTLIASKAFIKDQNQTIEAAERHQVAAFIESQFEIAKAEFIKVYLAE